MSNNVLPKEVSAGLGLGTSTLRNDLQKVQGGGGGGVERHLYARCATGQHILADLKLALRPIFLRVNHPSCPYRLTPADDESLFFRALS